MHLSIVTAAPKGELPMDEQIRLAQMGFQVWHTQPSPSDEYYSDVIPIGKPIPTLDGVLTVITPVRLVPVLGEKRYWAGKVLKSVDEIDQHWEKGILGLPPDIIGVQFSDVQCQSVCGMRRGQIDRVVMLDPTDPIRSPLVSFRLKLTLKKRAVRIEIDWRKTGEVDVFKHVVRVCERKFSQPGEVTFQGRKEIKRAKRRFLFWLEQVGKLPSDLNPLFEQITRTNGSRDQKPTALRGADKHWGKIVSFEQETIQPTPTEVPE